MSATETYGNPYTLEGPRGGRYAWTVARVAHPEADRKTAEVQAVLSVFWNRIDQQYTVALNQVTSWTVLGIQHTSANTDVPTQVEFIHVDEPTRSEIRAFARDRRDAVSGTEDVFRLPNQDAVAA